MSNHSSSHLEQGLAEDLKHFVTRQFSRRHALMLGVGGATALLSGCGANTDDSTASSSTTSSATSSTSNTSSSSTNTSSSSSAESSVSSCGKIPEETQGPYPGDGSNGQNALTRSGIVRQDIRSSLSTGTTAQGVPLTVKIKLVNVNNSCAALSGYAIYLWHCDRAGNYSMYSSGVTNEDYLRGVQQTDSNGMLSFSTIFPGCYSGRWPHIHFEIYPSLNSATIYSNKIATSQLAFPKETCQLVYATTGYSSSVSNLSKISLSSDNIFSDGYSLQMVEITGNTTDGYIATLVVGVAV